MAVPFLEKVKNGWRVVAFKKLGECRDIAQTNAINNAAVKDISDATLAREVYRGRYSGVVPIFRKSKKWLAGSAYFVEKLKK